MEFEEVVNPHYAFPIVCVVVCALLVFAFGFKSPGQPPSFDAVLEEERKSTKKRKGKDNQKSKPQQNGRPGGITTSNKSESGSQSTKGKAAAAEKNAIKSEPKQTKKNRISQYKKTEAGIDAFVVTADDNNEGEWVQQLSKKERKNRKREEIISSSLNNESEKPAVTEAVESHQNLTEQSCDSQESSPKKKGKRQQKEPEGSKSNRNDFLQTKGEKLPLQEVELKLEAAAKEQRAQKKKKGQKDETKIPSTTDNNISVRVCDNEEASENINSENGTTDLISTPNEEEIVHKTQEREQNTEDSVPKDDPKVQLKKKKGKKKNQENNLDVYETMPDDVTDAAETKSVSTAIVDNVPETTTIPETRFTKPADLPPPDIENEKDGENEMQGESNKDTPIGSNVVFDELGDMWQNPKPQKKKKRARREQ